MNNTTGRDIEEFQEGLTSEMIAAVAKIMSNLDLIYGAKKIKVTAHCNTTIGEEGRLINKTYNLTIQQIIQMVLLLH